MAFQLFAIGGGGGTTVYDLNSSPFRLRSAAGLGVAPLHRITERGPFQDGDTDLGVRLDPRTITLGLDIIGTSAADLDTQRDTFRNIFKPTAASPVKLRITRDDGEIRQIDCYTSVAEVSLVPEHRPGNLLRTAVQLRASNPLWYAPTPGTVQFDGNFLTDWWTAGATIGTANVLEHVENPGTAQAWAWAGTANAAYSIAIQAGYNPNDDEYAWSHSPDTGAFMVDNSTPAWRVYVPGQGDVFETITANNSTLMTAGTQSYIVTVQDLQDGIVYRNGGSVVAAPVFIAPQLKGTAGMWRNKVDGPTAGNQWDSGLTKAAIYDIKLNATQVAALNTAMSDTGGGTILSANLAYLGDYVEYPTIRITGEIEDPVLTNVTTGKKLDFTGVTIGSGDYYDIDLRYGNKTVVDSGGSNQLGNLTSDSDLATFAIVPDPVVTGGTNVITLAGSASGTETAAVVTYYNRYTAF